uniref:Uncharacterized protein n=1 Tax=viral metagenome TaxID=1070528 RepID=A0A6C0JEY2_9ZZZZ
MKIAIIGKLCSGKSTCAKYLIDKYDYTCLSFGEPVKRYAKEIFGLETKNRVIIQDFAQKIKEIDNDVWIKYLIRKLDNLQTDKIVIDDLRFPNEYNALKNKGFIFIKLIISEEKQKERIINTYPDSFNTHIERTKNISESYTNVLKSDYVIDVTNIDKNMIFDFLENVINYKQDNK